MQEHVLALCRDALPGWAHLSVADVTFDAPKGFSSYTLTIRVRDGARAEPRAVFYRRLEGKETRDLIPLSHYMYAMASIPLAVEPIQKIRFLPYAQQRFAHFLRAYDERFPGG